MWVANQRAEGISMRSSSCGHPGSEAPSLPDQNLKSVCVACNVADVWVNHVLQHLCPWYWYLGAPVGAGRGTLPQPPAQENRKNAAIATAYADGCIASTTCTTGYRGDALTLRVYAARTTTTSSSLALRAACTAHARPAPRSPAPPPATACTETRPRRPQRSWTTQ